VVILIPEQHKCADVVCNFMNPNYHQLLLVAVAYSFPFVLHAQDNLTKYSFKTEVEKKNAQRKRLAKGDTLYISFDYGYRNDIVAIRSPDGIFSSDTLNTDNLYGFAGYLKLPKAFLRKPVEILFNGQLLARIKVKEKYSSVHMEFYRRENAFIWRYHKYSFAYL
jgi:hypothetical protein